MLSPAPVVLGIPINAPLGKKYRHGQQPHATLDA